MKAEVVSFKHFMDGGYRSSTFLRRLMDTSSAIYNSESNFIYAFSWAILTPFIAMVGIDVVLICCQLFADILVVL
jgi:aspartyl/asparaginyl beta-hydroxylase (cupin superfamily)